MSGGVDSAVTAFLLQQRGYNVECVFMKNWEEDSDYCTTEKDYKDALLVCDHLGLPLHTVNFAKEYKDRVFSLFLKEYGLGRTPNPDTLCNKEIKFKAFLDYAIALGANKIATGHYAEIDHSNNQFSLLKGLDKQKDQSYFLYLLDQHQLSKAIFPLGNMTKKDVREIAKENKFPNADRKDSTGVCFIGERNFREFLSQYFKSHPGDMVTPDGKKVGTHDGLVFYTIGQRQGLGIGGGFGSKEEPWFVADKDINNNTLVVVQGHDHTALFHKTFMVNQLHWIHDVFPNENEISVKIRYRQQDKRCKIVEPSKDEIIVEFEEPQFAVTPGQAAVFYNENICLGGGTIKSRN